MKLKRLMAGVLSAAMLLSVSSTLAFAASGENVTIAEGSATAEVKIYSTMYVSTDAVTTPNVEYTYTLTSGYNATYTEYVAPESEETAAEGIIYAGDLDAVAEDKNTVSFASATISDAAVVKNFTLTFTAEDFATTGVYHYILTETGPVDEDDTDGVSGLNNEIDQVRHIYVTIMDNDGLYISQILMTEGAIVVADTENEGEYLEQADSEYTKSTGYLHSYGIDTDDGDEDTDKKDEDPIPDDDDDGDSTSATFTVTFTAVGTMADKNLSFGFTTIAENLGDIFDGMAFPVDYTAEDGTEYFYMVKDSSLVLATEGTEGYEAVTDEDDAYDFYLASGGSFTVLAVIEGMTFTTDIDTETNTGYTYYYKNTVDDNWISGSSYGYTIGTKDEDSVDFAAAQGEVDSDDYPGITSAAGFPSTGVVLDLAPYAIMMVLALGAISFRFVRVARKNEE